MAIEGVKRMSYQEFVTEAALSRYASGDDGVFIESMTISTDEGGYGYQEFIVVSRIAACETEIAFLYDNMQAIVMDGLRRWANGELVVQGLETRRK